MPSITRFRSRQQPAHNGGTRVTTVKNLFTGQTTQETETFGTTWTRLESCDDSITIAGPYEDHALTIYKESQHVAGVSGRIEYNLSGFTPTTVDFQGWCPNELGDPAILRSFQFPTPNVAFWQTKAIAGANPNAPTLDLPNFLFELRDMPGMVRDLGRVLRKQVHPQDVPGGYLAYRFGWAPLISDLKSYLLLTDSINSRLTDLDNADRGRTSTRTLKSGAGQAIEGIGSVSRIYQHPTQPGQHLDVRTSSTYNEKVWSTYHLRMTSEDIASQSALLEKGGFDTQSFLLGMNGLSASTIWESMPWSWLVDYFTNVGDFLDSGRGNMSFELLKFNLMVNQFYILRHTEENNTLSGVSFRKGTLKAERKLRFPFQQAKRTITTAPFLTGGEQNILLALLTAAALKKAT